MRYLFVVLTVLCGCDRPDAAQVARREQMAREDKAESEACLARGGIVVRSGWDWRIVECRVGPSVPKAP